MTRGQTRETGYKSVLDFGREAEAKTGAHGIGDYPTKILPQVARMLVQRFSREGDTILDPFCGAATFAIEAKGLGRDSINYDINPKAVALAQRRLSQAVLFPKHHSTHTVEVRDARNLPLGSQSVDAIITDIPYASMIKYSDLPDDLSTIEDYPTFLREVTTAFQEMWRVLKLGRYCVIFVADYRIGAARCILPVHADVIHIMRSLGFVLFDLYIWRYYRSGAFRPFGRRPFQAMNLHSYILVFHKPDGAVSLHNRNRPVRYRTRLLEKVQNNLSAPQALNTNSPNANV